VPVPDWARVHGPPLFAATIRQHIEDFVVHELLGFEFSGDGEHDYLHIEKRAANTEWVGRQLAAFADVPARDIGYSGMKDRHAVARQWFSVPRWNQPDWQGLEIDGVRVLEQQRHQRKLKRGAHQTNYFRIVLRGEVSMASGIDERLAAIAAEGVPNYFGEQRFGRGGGNLAMADQWAAGKRLPRHKRSIAISSARSFLFNQNLQQRVQQQTWNRLLPGDVANLDGSGSVFTVESVDEDIERRCQEMDLHPAGVLWGDGASKAGIAEEYLPWCTALENARAKVAHRSLRLRPQAFSWTMDAESVTLEFSLRRGSFATAVLREVAVIADAQG
jgi:tRNA pseudouridine13 synthase